LTEYAAFHHAEPKIWAFATGDKKAIDSLTNAFSVYRQNEKGTISHGLATALINRNGIVEKIWRVTPGRLKKLPKSSRQRASE